MALLDFYQLAVLHNLRRRDADFLSKHSYPPMPASSTKHKSVPFNEFVRPKTPPHRPDPATVQALLMTPNSCGSSVRRKQEGDTDRADKYDRGDYEEYIREDLSCRVFVDFEVFMKRVLHVPDDWRTQWGRDIEAVKGSTTFDRHRKRYSRLCDEGATQEKEFYPELVKMANAVLDVVSRVQNIPRKERKYYHVNDPNHLRGGMMSKKHLSPDLVQLDKEHPGPNKLTPLHWANPLHVMEVKPTDNALCDGTNMPRLVVGGKRARGCFRARPPLTLGQESIRSRTTHALPRSCDTGRKIQSPPRRRLSRRSLRPHDRGWDPENDVREVRPGSTRGR